MATGSETTLDKNTLGKPLYKWILPTGPCDCCTEEPSDHKKRTSEALSDSQVEGQWICTTDLLQKGQVKKRPRLLPHDVKMFVYVQNESRKRMDFPSWDSNQYSATQAQAKENWDREEMSEVDIQKKIKTVQRKLFPNTTHPKKRFLQRYFQQKK